MRLLEAPPRLVQRVERGVERLDAGLDQSSGAWAPRRSSRRSAAESVGMGDAVPGHRLMRLVDLASDLLGLHHRWRAARQALPPRPAAGASLSSSSTAWRRKSASRARLLDPRAVLGKRRLGIAPARDAPPARHMLSQPAEGIEQSPVRAGVHQRAVIVLAVDLDQRARRWRAAPAR